MADSSAIPGSLGQVAESAFASWAAATVAESGADLANASERAQIDTATLYLDSLLKFVSAAPGGDDVAAATAEIFEGLSGASTDPAQIGVLVNNLVASTSLAFGPAANTIVFQVELGAMGFAQAGATGLQAFGSFGRDVGTVLGTLGAPALAQFSNSIGASLNAACHT